MTARPRGASLVVLAKAPVAGRSKTRCSPPCTPWQAAQLAEAALADTLDAVLATPAARHVLVLDGEPGSWLPEGLEVVGQRGDGLDERLAAAFDDVGGPAVLIGMDTPQLHPGLLGHSLLTLADPHADAVLGLSTDGGYWAVGLIDADPALFLGVPMSRADTGQVQLDRLREHGRRVRLLPELTDVDTFRDAMAVAAQRPGQRFSATVSAIAADVATSADPQAPGSR